MISKATRRFWKCYKALEPDLKRQAKDSYLKFKKDPYYLVLNFKQIHSTKPIYSVRISLEYRALGVFNENTIIWMWIGSHAEYDKLIKNL